jgi:hypothetical protein
MKTITEAIVKKDILFVAAGLKMDISDKVVDRVLCEYDDYRTQYRDEHWSELVEIMLYDYERFEKESGPFDQLGYEQTTEE